MLLATTAIEDTWGANEPIVFLGEWCRIYERKAVWSQREHRVVPNHWNAPGKLKNDHDYLKGLHDSILAKLAVGLNSLHGLDRSVRYWQTIFDPWLLTYVAVIWDRWECARVALDEVAEIETLVLDGVRTITGFLDYEDFISEIQSDTWNHALFLQILEFGSQHKGKVRVLPAPPNRLFEPHHIARTKGRKLSFKHQFAAAIDDLLGRLLPASKIVIFDSYFSIASLVKLSVRLRQVPRLHLRDFSWDAQQEPKSFNPGMRTALSRNIQSTLLPRNAFEDFLFRKLADDIPRVHVEGFSSIRARANDIKLSPRAIFTANAHWSNELFKLWVTEQVIRGAKYVTMEHGSGIPPAFSAMAFEEDTSDIKTSWARPFHSKHRQMPASKLTALTITSAGDNLAVIGFDMPRYGYRVEAAPKSDQVLTHCEMLCDLFAMLTPDVQRMFSIRPFPMAGKQGWSIRQRLVDRLGSARISIEPNYHKFLSRAKMIVCTYPQTTFSEAMTTGIPTMLMYPKAYWDTIPAMNETLEKLVAARIVSHDAASTAANINAVWHDPGNWWNSPQTSAARKAFRDNALAMDRDWLDKWASFIEAAAT